MQPPAELLHVWHSRADSLRDRSLEIRNEWLVFGIGRHVSETYRLNGIKSTPRQHGTHYVLHYEDRSGNERQLGILYHDGTPPTLQLDYHDETWVRWQDATWLSERAEDPT